MASRQSEGKHPSQRRYPPELEERAVRMALDAIAEQGGRQISQRDPWRGRLAGVKMGVG